MNFESIKVTPFGSAIAPVCFLFQYPIARDADIVANSYRKTVDSTGMTHVQRFDCFPGMEEEFCQRFSYPVHSAVKPAFTQHAGHQSGRTKLMEVSILPPK
jgi:hypothetical protein